MLSTGKSEQQWTWKIPQWLFPRRSETRKELSFNKTPASDKPKFKAKKNKTKKTLRRGKLSQAYKSSASVLENHEWNVLCRITKLCGLLHVTAMPNVTTCSKILLLAINNVWNLLYRNRSVDLSPSCTCVFYWSSISNCAIRSHHCFIYIW